jgi:hypothetical protein
MSVPHALAILPGLVPPAARPPGWTRHTLLRAAGWHVVLDVFAGNELKEMPADPWPSAVLPLLGGFTEQTSTGTRHARPGRCFRRSARQRYRLNLPTRPCPACAGYDDALGNACPLCGGMGTVAVRTLVLVVIKSG